MKYIFIYSLQYFRPILTGSNLQQANVLPCSCIYYDVHHLIMLGLSTSDIILRPSNSLGEPVKLFHQEIHVY